jgi:hypothetical protein
MSPLRDSAFPEGTPMPPTQPDPETQRELWMRRGRGETWQAIGWLPPVTGHPRSGEISPDDLEDALHDLLVPEHAVAGICPWPDPPAADRGVAAGELTVIDEDDLARVLITADARDALTCPPAWDSSRFDPDLTLRATARRARQYAVLVPFAVCLWADNYRYTMTAVMRPDPGTSRKRDVVITLWSQVRDAARAADKAEREWAAAEYAAGRDPYPTP